MNRLILLLLFLAATKVSAQKIFIDTWLPRSNTGFSGISNPNQEEKYYIIFAGTKMAIYRGDFGHAFIILGKESPQNGISVIAAYGFYPAKESMTSSNTLNNLLILNGFISPGIVRDEIQHDVDRNSLTLTSIGSQLSLRISKEQYFAATAAINKAIVDHPQYLFAVSDCISFVKGIGQSIGLNMPDREPFQTPDQYVSTLVKTALSPSTLKTAAGKELSGKEGGIFSYGLNINGNFTGHKREKFRDGTFRDGYWLEGKLKGQYVYTFTNGEILIKNDATGKSEYHYIDGTINEDYNGAAPNSTTVLRLPNGDTYSGESINGRPQGKGSLQKQDGTFLYGRFENGVLTSYMPVNFPNGKYVGPIRNGLPEGEGTFVFLNDDSYSGSFRNGRYNGKGVYRSKNAVWEGTFGNNFSSFNGTIHFSDGHIYTGIANNGIFASPETYRTTGSGFGSDRGGRPSQKSDGKPDKKGNEDFDVMTVHYTKTGETIRANISTSIKY